MKRKIEKSIRSLICFLLVFSMVFTPCANVFATEQQKDTLDYVVLGDSMTNGYCMPGYYPNGDYTDYGNVRGYQINDIEEIYSYQFAKYLQSLPENTDKTVKMHQLAISGMRAEELRFLLDEKYQGDAYTWERFDSENLEDGERWFAKVFRDKHENLPADAGNDRLRREYQEAIANAEIISINIGANNFGTFITDEIRADLTPGESGRTYHMEEVLGENLSVDNLRQQLIAILSSKGLSVESNGLLEKYVDLFIYTYAGFVVNLTKSVSLIRKTNPKAEIIIFGLINNFEGMKVTIDEAMEPIPLDEMYQAVIDAANYYMVGMDIVQQNQLKDEEGNAVKPAIYVSLEKVHLMVDAMGEKDTEAPFDAVNDILERKSVSTLTSNIKNFVSKELQTRKTVNVSWEDLKENFDETEFLALEDEESKAAYLTELINGEIDEKIKEVLIYAMVNDLADEELIKSFVKEYFKPAEAEQAVMPKGIDVAYDLSGIIADEEIQTAEVKEYISLMSGEQSGQAKELEKWLVTEIYLGLRKAIYTAAANPGLDVTDYSTVIGNGLEDTLEKIVGLVSEPVKDRIEEKMSGEADNEKTLHEAIAEALLEVETMKAALHVYAHFMIAEGMGNHPDAKGHQEIFEKLAAAYESRKTTTEFAEIEIDKLLKELPNLIEEFGIYEKLGIEPGADMSRALQKKYYGSFMGEYVPEEDSYYVSIGDSSVVGVGLPGFSNGGYQADMEVTFADKLAKELGVDYIQLGQAGLRTEDIHYILDETYEPDDYTLDKVLKEIETFGGGIGNYRKTFKEEIEKADLITVGMANGNFTSFVTAQIGSKLSGQDVYEMDWSRYVTEKGVPYIEKLLGELKSYLAESGLDIEIDFDNEMLQMAMGIADLKVAGKLNIADFFVEVIESYAYSYAGFLCSYAEVLELIKEINPDAQVVVLGSYNPMAGTAINFQDFGVEEGVIELGDMLNEFYDFIGLHFTAYAMFHPNTTYVEMPEVETIFTEEGENGNTIKLINKVLDTLKMFGLEFELSKETISFVAYLLEMCTKDGEAMNPSADGHSYMKERICQSLVTVKTDNGFWLDNTNWKFTGEEIYPTVYNRFNYKEGIDYEVTYENVTDPGKDTAKVIITGLYEDVGEAELPFTITVVDVDESIVNGIDLSDVDIRAMSGSLDSLDQTYTGKALKPQIKVYHGTEKLTAGKEYTISYKNNKNVFVYNENMSEEELVNIPTITIKGKGNYTGTQTIHFNIHPQDISKSEDGMKYSYKNGLVYNKGKNLSPAFVLKCGKTALKAGRDYIMTYIAEDGSESTDVSQPGNYILTVKGTGNYSGQLNLSLTVAEQKKLVSKLKISAKKIPYGEKIADYVTVKDGKNTLTIGTDYVLEYDEEAVKNAGKHNVTVKGIGNYAGSKDLSVTITGISITKNVKVTGLYSAVTYTGKRFKPNGKDFEVAMKVKADGKYVYKPLTEGTDYVISYSDNVTNKGTVKLTFKGVGNYTGSFTKSFKINAYNLTDAIENGDVELMIDEQVSFSKSGAKPGVKVFFKDKVLIEGKDYTLSYSNHKKLFDYHDALTGSQLKKAPKVTVKGKGNFSGSASAYYSIGEKDIQELTVIAPNVVFSPKAGNYKTTVTVMDENGKKLSSGKDYKISYEYDNGVPVGSKDQLEVNKTVILKIAAVNGSGFAGTYTQQIKILHIKLDKLMVNKPGFWYTGEKILLTDKNGELKRDDSIGQTLLVYRQIYTFPFIEELKLGEDYIIIERSYSNNMKKGTASVMIQGIGNYAGTYTVTYQILPRPTWLEIFDKKIPKII